MSHQVQLIVLLVAFVLVFGSALGDCNQGSVFSFGLNYYGQLGDGTQTLFKTVPTAVSASGPLSGQKIHAVASGGSHSLVLSESGQVFSFGSNGYGQLGDGTFLTRHAPVAVNTSGVLNGTNIVAISAGYRHSLVLSDSGKVFSFGYNNYGQLGDNTTLTRIFAVAVNTSGVLSDVNITAISAGEYHSLVLGENGRVFAFGRNDNGQLGEGRTANRKLVPVAVDTSGVLKDVEIIAIAAGSSFSVVLSATGQVFSFGDNNRGQLGDGTNNERHLPVAVVTSGALNGTNITAISAGNEHVLFLSVRGQVFSVGYNGYGQLGDNTTNTRYVPVAMNTSGDLDGANITAIAAGTYSSLILTESGKAFSFGRNNNGQLGDGTTTTRRIPVQVSTSGALSGAPLKAISIGEHSLVVSASGKVFSFGLDSSGQLGDDFQPGSQTPIAVSTSGVLSGVQLKAVAGGDYHSLVLSSTGQVFSFGENGYGQLGDGTTIDRQFPVAVNNSGALNGTTIIAIAAGSAHSLVLASNGKVFSFGDNGNGQLGDGTWTDRALPVAVNTSGDLNGTEITAIAAGNLHSIVLSATGQVFTFGLNEHGQLGDGSVQNRKLPVALNLSSLVVEEIEFVAIAAGSSHSLVLSGLDESAHLNIESCSLFSTILLLSPNSAEGEVFSFGYNRNGQLGDGTETESNLPIPIFKGGELKDHNISAIAAGDRHSLVLSCESHKFPLVSDSEIVIRNSVDCLSVFPAASGKLFAFGSNGNGQLGNTSFYSSDFPIAVNISVEIAAIAAANRQSFVLSSQFSFLSSSTS